MRKYTESCLMDKKDNKFMTCLELRIVRCRGLGKDYILLQFLLFFGHTVMRLLETVAELNRSSSDRVPVSLHPSLFTCLSLKYQL